MMQKLERLPLFLNQKHGFFWIGLILTISLLWPLTAASYFSHHDDVQAIRLYELDKCLKDGQIPCRWVPDLGGLYGYPLFNYYGPLPYYYGEFFYLLSSSLLISAKIMFATSFVGAYLFMYLLGRKLWGEMGGSLSGVFYSLAPYHSVDFYVRGAMGELWGLMFMPALIWAMIRIKDAPRLGNSLLLGLFIALIILSHNLSALIFLPVMLLFGLVLLLEGGFNQKALVKLAGQFVLSILFGLLLSSFYLLPMLVEKNLVHVETTTYGYFSYTEHFKGLRKLFLDRSWGWGSSVREVPGGERDGLSFQIGIVHLVGLLLGILLLKRLYNKSRAKGIMVTFLIVVFILSVYMIHPQSLSIWKLIEPLKFLQFPWRFLGLTILCVSLIAGSIFIGLKERYQFSVWAVLIILVVALNFGYFRPEKLLNFNENELLSGPKWEVSIKRSIFDYLPIFAEAPPAQLATSRYELVTGDTRVYDYHQGSDWIKFKATTIKHTILRLSQYYFPDWKVFVDGKEVVTNHTNQLGLITFILGVGDHTVEARLFNTQIRTIANLISLFGLIVYLILGLLQPPKLRNWIFYYIKALNR